MNCLPSYWGLLLFGDFFTASYWYSTDPGHAQSTSIKLTKKRCSGAAGIILLLSHLITAVISMDVNITFAVANMTINYT